MSTAFVDAEAVIKEWLNADTTLTAVMPKGVLYREQRSPGKGTYAYVTRIGGGDSDGDTRIDLATLSFAVYGLTKAGAAAAAVALANSLRELTGNRVESSNARIVGVDGITGPTYVLDGDVPRYIVDATVMIQPVP